jgi:hypothetical protein
MHLKCDTFRIGSRVGIADHLDATLMELTPAAGLGALGPKHRPDVVDPGIAGIP